MLLTLVRMKKTKHAVMGVLLVDGKMMCDTMEPPLEPNATHPKGAIPMGYYKLSLTHSPRFNRVLLQEKGVSRLIELDVTQVESKLGMKAAEQ